MQVDFSSNYFELFDLDASFDIDEGQLRERFRALQRVLHPDRYAAAPDSERRWSMQAASFVNEAYQTLSRPLPRAQYLLELQGISMKDDTDTQMAPEFLMEQMELREALDEVAGNCDPQLALDGIAQRLRMDMKECANAYRGSAREAQWAQARIIARQWQFLDKVRREVQEREAQLDES